MPAHAVSACGWNGRSDPWSGPPALRTAALESRDGSDDLGDPEPECRPARGSRLRSQSVRPLYLVRFAAPEFTALCPVTGQPDFAHLVIDYAPDGTIVESKSLKLFLSSFRSHKGFHEDVTVGIGQRLAEEMKPLWLRIGGYWYPRGGIPIDVFWQSGEPPRGLWLPDQGVSAYRGRG